MPPIRFAAVALAASWVLAGGALSPVAVIATAAGATALVAARERRHRAMALAAGIMIGISASALALLPVLVGTAIARRAAVPALFTLTLAAAGTTLSVGWIATPNLSLASILPESLRLLPIVAGCGVSAWLTASCAARSPSARELEAAALFGLIALPLLVPVGGDVVGLAVALAIGGTRLTLAPIARAANDAPLPLRAARA